jgi:hypothetical protein
MGPGGIFSSVIVLFASFYFYPSFIPDPSVEVEPDSYQDTSNMNVAKKIAANVIKLAPNGPVRSCS